VKKEFGLSPASFRDRLTKLVTKWCKVPELVSGFELGKIF